jgi:predicted nuclease of predicted toxin-antitoxin system
LALVRGIPPKIIWIREGNLSTSELANLLVQNHQIILSFMFGKEALEENACLEL